MDPGDGRAIYIIAILPILYAATLVPPYITEWAQHGRPEYRPGKDAIAYVGVTAATVASMTASSMIGELSESLGKNKPPWWILTVTALFLAVLHLAKNAVLETPTLVAKQEAEDAKKKAEEQQLEIQRLKSNLEFAQEPERRIDALQELLLKLI